MKTELLFFTILLSFTSSYAQNDNPKYDASLAQQLGADEYGMKNYVFVLLKTGTNTTTDKQFIADCFAGHMTNIAKLANAKKLIVAGPMGKNEANLRGIFILNVATIEEANQLLDLYPDNILMNYLRVKAALNGNESLIQQLNSIYEKDTNFIAFKL